VKDKMRTARLFEPPADLADPRLHPDFDAEAWPLCNGAAGPSPGTADLYERRCLEFLAVYYRLNRLQKHLLAARREPPTRKAVRPLLAELTRTARVLERLEDRYAPIGFFGEPVMEGVFYRDVHFVRPALQPSTPTGSCCSSHIAIPGLETIPPSELQGPVTVTRLDHGQMDF
jgi:hypothetical protein